MRVVELQNGVPGNAVDSGAELALKLRDATTVRAQYGRGLDDLVDDKGDGAAVRDGGGVELRKAALSHARTTRLRGRALTDSLGEVLPLQAS